MRIAALALTTLLGGCVFFGNGGDDSSCENQACTDLFASVGVNIVNASGQAVTGMATWTLYVPTGAMLHESSNSEYGYVVVDDNLDRSLLLAGNRHEVQFFAEGPAGTATANFVISAGPCVCHVEKLIGPETLVVTP